MIFFFLNLSFKLNILVLSVYDSDIDLNFHISDLGFLKQFGSNLKITNSISVPVSGQIILFRSCVVCVVIHY